MRSVLVRGVGHLSLPIHRRVVHEISVTLAHLHHHGETVALGVTSITSEVERPAASRPAALTRTARSQAGHGTA